MRKWQHIVEILLVLAILVIAYAWSTGDEGFMEGFFSARHDLSGEMRDGYRELSLAADTTDSIHFDVNQLDYVKFVITDSPSPTKPHRLQIPDLGVDAILRTGSRNPFVKFSEPGQFTFSLGERPGRITVHPHAFSHYMQVEGVEAFELVYRKRAVVIDVRLAPEYRSGYIGRALHIPFAELEDRLDELRIYSDDPILVYGATGNRGNPAADMLFKAGFREVYHLENGIVGWASMGYSVTPY